MPAVMLFADTERSPAMRHEVPLAISDPFLFVDTGGRRVVLTTILERTRIAAAVPALELLDMFEFGLRALIVDERRSRDDAIREVVTRAVLHLGVRSAVVPGDFPLGLGDRLRAAGVGLAVDDEAIANRRRLKSAEELVGIRAAQRAAEAGMRAAASLLAAAQPDGHGRLSLGGRTLQAEDVRGAMRAACARCGAHCPPDVIVSSVWNGTGHEPGRGPLPAGLPIQVDLWPRDEATGCWADMTRTFLVGAPAEGHARLIAEQQRLVRAALEEARAMTRPGITGRELYDAACRRFEAAGRSTQHTGPGDDPAEGFQFALGHGVGLALHEAPGLGLAGAEPLVAGDVVAVEPGLWDRRIGGVRYEDLLLVTESGCETLTNYRYELAPQGE